MADKHGASTSVESNPKRQKLDDEFQKTTLQEFEAVFPKLKADLMEHAQKYNLPDKELEWFKNVSPNARRFTQNKRRASDTTLVSV